MSALDYRLSTLSLYAPIITFNEIDYIQRVSFENKIQIHQFFSQTKSSESDVEAIKQPVQALTMQPLESRTIIHELAFESLNIASKLIFQKSIGSDN